MAKLALITEKQYRPGINERGDIVGIFDDDQPIQKKALEAFHWVVVDLTKESLALLIPEVRPLWKSKTTEWTEEPPEEIECWRDKDGSYRKIVKQPKYKQHYDAGIISETFSRYSENLTIIIDKDGKVIG
jgi:hypothetical protein